MWRYSTGSHIRVVLCDTHIDEILIDEYSEMILVPVTIVSCGIYYRH